jgi:hypothetical protein
LNKVVDVFKGNAHFSSSLYNTECFRGGHCSFPRFEYYA